MRRANFPRRRGSILPLTVCLLLVLFAFLALSVDLGMMALARNHCQNAADAAATAAARTITGDADADYNFDAVPTNGIAAAVANKVLGVTIQGSADDVTEVNDTTFQSGNVKLEIGSYAYYYSDDDPAPDVEGFKLKFPRERETDSWSAVKATVTAPNMQTYFAPVLGMTAYTTGATATAVHRPRDVVIIMDMSGSMRFQSLPGTPMSGSDANPSSSSTARTKSLNPESIFPRFGHYSAVATAALQGTTGYATSGDEFVDPGNISTTTSSGPPIIEDFYQNISAGTRAFTRADDSKQSTPGGDNYLTTQANTTSTYAKTVNDILDTTNANYALRCVAWENYGYDAFSGDTFHGYTEGPGYWGKTFFTWPPDPRSATSSTASDNGAKDWRQRFFFKRNNVGGALSPLDHDNILFNPSGVAGNGSNPIIKLPTTTTTVQENGVSVSYQWRPNYAAIFKWLKESPAPFPDVIRAGRIKYYDSIPDHTDTNLNTRLWTSHPPSNLNERFWKEYVDFILGIKATGNTTWTNLSNVPLSSLIGNGDYMTWGTLGITQKPDVVRYVGGPTVTVNGDYSTGGGYNANISVTGVPSDPDPIPGWYVRFGNHDQLYVVGQVTMSSGKVSAFQLSTGHATNSASTRGLQVPVPRDTKVEFFAAYDSSNNRQSFQVGKVNNSSGYTAGSGYSSSINVKGLPLNTTSGYSGFPSVERVQVGDYIRFGNDIRSLYRVTSVSPSSGQVTSFRIDDGKGQGLRTAVDDNVDIHFIRPFPGSISYTDNVFRPRHQLWFGPMTWVDWLGNYNTSKFWWPGNVHEAQAWACKVGVQSAIEDIRSNHPNDFISLIYFSSAKTSNGGSGQHNRAKVSMGQSYTHLVDSLWFPPTTITGGVSEITPYSADMSEVPRANGGTSPAMGFMLAYNQLSSSYSSLRSYASPTTTYRGDAGGLGRKGSQRLIIFETDGAPNVLANAALEGSGGDAYYEIRVKNPADISHADNTEWPAATGTLDTQLYGIVDQICALESANGFSTERKPVLIHCLAYGSLYEPANSGTTQTNALKRLEEIQYRGNTQSAANVSLPDYKRIYGTNDERIERMRQAFTLIMQDGVQVSLIE